MTNFTIIKEQNNFRLEAYLQNSGNIDYYIVNPINKTWSVCINSKSDALSEFEKVVKRNCI